MDESGDEVAVDAKSVCGTEERLKLKPSPSAKKYESM
jgi:hypothetical protein